ncbi:MAG TPA: 3-hydroxyacyl-CoA dehydrogenase [Trebonia sp.]|nr:3-hydroxyacyl-CoA dehydrogenase [Trebonia sp.]
MSPVPVAGTVGQPASPPPPGRMAIVGAGSIGLAWSVVFARAQWSVSLFDIAGQMRDAAPAAIERRLGDLHRVGLLPEPVEAVMARIAVTADLSEAVDGVTWVQESVVESIEVKRGLFAQLDELTDGNVVLASSSSMIAASRWADGLPGRQRCLVVHPGNPPYLLTVAEVVPAPFTSQQTIQRAQEVLASAGMSPVLVHGEPEGFVFNRLQGALLREAYCLVRDGVISPADVDRVVKEGLGRRWAVLGPFETSHLNTRGGIRRHAELMGPAYERMGAERGQHDPWTPDLVATVAADLEVRLPMDRWEEYVAGRDAALLRRAAQGKQQEEP